MIREEIERLLERGIRLGFKVSTNDQNYLGWILFDKQKPNLRILRILDESVHPRD